MRERVGFFDGVRALAVLAVMAYHSAIPGLRVGGFYGVDAFFVLSGLLITHLLLEESGGAAGRVALAAFWGRRARRLFPALAVMLLAVDLYVVWVAPEGTYPRFRGDALSVVGYMSNWHFISAGSDYFAVTDRPSLLTHTWSLAIEEQFYLVWPLMIVGLSRLARRARRRPASVVLVVSAAGALLSAAWMAYLYRNGAAPSRLYYGTDTHAQCLLVGAVVAAWLHRSGRGLAGGSGPVAAGRSRRSTARLWDAAAAVAAAVLCFMVARVGSGSGAAYQGGFLLFACAVASVLVSLAASPRGFAARALSVRPLVYLGTISYGMYLWYFPLFEVLTRARTGLAGPALFALRAVVDVAVASLSYRLVERPIRSSRPFRIDPARSLSGLGTVGLSAVGLVAAVAAVAADVPGRAAAVAVAPPPAGAATTPAGAATTPPEGPALRLLVTGDSTALTLGLALANAQVDRAYGLVVSVRATLGCGVAMSAKVRDHGSAMASPPACDPSAPASKQWPALLRAAVAEFHPDVVLVAAGRWELLDRQATAGGRWQDITQPADEAYVQAQLRLATSVVWSASAGAKVVVATAPCFSSGEQPSGDPWPEDSPVRVSAYNRAVREVAAASGGKDALLDLGAIVCPGGVFRQTIDGITVRAPDGIHYTFTRFFSDPVTPEADTAAQTEAFARWIAARIVPVLSAAAGRGP